MSIRVFAIILIAITLLAGCGSDDQLEELELYDFIFPVSTTPEECSLKPADTTTGIGGNPVFSAEHDYMMTIASRWLDEEHLVSTQAVVLSIYQGENQTGEIILFGAEYDSNSTAYSAEKYLKQKYPDKSGNAIYRGNELVIMLQKNTPESDKCFDKLKSLVEDELTKVRPDIQKKF